MNIKKTEQNPTLKFTPTAWAKFIFMRDVTDNEVGAFGITDPDDLLLVKDIVVVKQSVTSVSILFDDEAVANFFEDQVERGKTPEQFARVWLHSHPGDSPKPSITDEETFQRVFGNCNWAVMCIVAKNSDIFARLRFNIGPKGQMHIPVLIDHSVEFEAADFDLWEKQYRDNVTEENTFTLKTNSKTQKQDKDVFGDVEEFEGNVFSIDELLEEIDMMHPAERQAFINELALKCDFWDQESEVLYE